MSHPAQSVSAGKEDDLVQCDGCGKWLTEDLIAMKDDVDGMAKQFCFACDDEAEDPYEPEI